MESRVHISAAPLLFSHPGVFGFLVCWDLKLSTRAHEKANCSFASAKSSPRAGEFKILRLVKLKTLLKISMENIAETVSYLIGKQVSNISCMLWKNPCLKSFFLKFDLQGCPELESHTKLTMIRDTLRCRSCFLRFNTSTCRKKFKLK